jgi:hypothetical protein
VTVKLGDIFPDYEIVHEVADGSVTFFLCVIGFTDRITGFREWVAEFTPGGLISYVHNGWSRFSPDADDLYDVILQVSFTDLSQAVFFKMRWM